MAFPNRDELKDKISEKIAHHLWHFGKSATNVTAIVASTYATNKAINYVTGRKNSWRSYINPLEYLRSTVQLPASLYAVRQLEEQSSSLLQQLGEKLQRVEPIAEKFMQPIIRAVVSPCIDALEADGLVKLPEPTLFQQTAEAATEAATGPLMVAKSFVTKPWKDNTPVDPIDSWQTVENEASKYGKMLVDSVSATYERSKGLRELPSQMMDVMTNCTGAPPLAIYGAVAGVALLTYFGTRSICNKISMGQWTKVDANANAHANGNVVNVIIPSHAPQPSPAASNNSPSA